MKKLFVVGLLLAATTGCGRGWFPHLFRGAPCNGLCSTPVPTVDGCENCAGYGGADVEPGVAFGDTIGTAPMQVYGDPMPAQPIVPMQNAIVNPK